ncbi:hypothetical protein [Streptomyces sp. NPDC005408]|uniref:hypothetical protein n=1 Tax=Streptomyces sp. NPDC005408 TaxID=3155341 RepID=UPI0033AE7263
MTTQTPSVRLQLGFFKDFATVAGLLRETGARREGPRLFVIDQDMSPAQAVALVRLLEYSRRDPNNPVKVSTTPTVLPRHTPSQQQFGDLVAWWGTVDDWR